MKTKGFGYKTAWLAVKGVDPQAVVEVLALRNTRPADWETGLDAAYEYRTTCWVFVTPPVDGWVLCVGIPLSTAVDERPQLLAEWAAALGTEVQYFATHRVVEAHAWARARPTGLERAYAYLGETGQKLLDHGPPTPEEKALGFAFFDPDSAEAQGDDYWGRKDLSIPGEEHVMALAGRWSLDPTLLEERALDTEAGWIGEFGDPPAPVVVKPRPKPWWKLW